MTTEMDLKQVKESDVDEVEKQFILSIKESMNDILSEMTSVENTTKREYLSSKLGISHSAIKKYLHCKAMPRFSIVARIALVTGRSLSQVMAEILSSMNIQNETLKLSTSKIEQRISEMLRPKQKDIFARYMDSKNDSCGNELQWSLGIASLVVQAPEALKNKIELAIVKLIDEEMPEILDNRQRERAIDFFRQSLLPKKPQEHSPSNKTH